VDALPLYQVPQEVREDAAKGISDFMIGLVRIYETDSGQDADLAGSGTLVQFDDAYGILTAYHVLDYLRNTNEIGLILATRFEPRLHRFTLRAEVLRPLKIAHGHEQSEGPDLGLLILPEVDVGSLKVWKSFYNLSHHRERILDNPPAHNEGLWFLCGFAGELTSERVPERGYARVKVFEGACGVGWVDREYYVEDFDYLEFEARYGGLNEPPLSFGGFSGAGLWQVPLVRTPEGTLKAKELLLSGVAFYQCARTEDRRVIKCHGRRSVYLHATQAVRGLTS
jgi:hypothetical protein